MATVRTVVPEGIEDRWTTGDYDPVFMLACYHATQGRGTADLYRALIAAIGALAEYLSPREVRVQTINLSILDPRDTPIFLNHLIDTACGEQLHQHAAPAQRAVVEKAVRQAIRIAIPVFPTRRVPR